MAITRGIDFISHEEYYEHIANIGRWARELLQQAKLLASAPPVSKVAPPRRRVVTSLPLHNSIVLLLNDDSHDTKNA